MVATYLIGDQLRLLNVVGFHPRYQNVWTRVKAVIATVVLIFLFLELFVQAMFKWNGLKSMQTIGLSMIMQQISHRAITMIKHRTKFVELLDCLDKMEYPNELKDLDRQRIKLLSRYGNICRKYVNFSLWSITILITITLVVIPLIIKEKVTYLPMYHYVNTETPYHEILSVVICIVAFILVQCLLIPFEFLFVSFVIYLLCEIKVFKKGLVSLGSYNMSHNEMIGFMVSRHCLILRCIELINNIYSGIFLNQYFCSAVCICSCLLGVVVEGSSDWSHNSLPFVSIVVALAQLFSLCMGGTLLMEECESVATAAYGCEWWRKTQPTLRKSLVLIIQRSHRSNMLVAGGLVPMNLTSFTRVLKGVYSYYSLLKSVYEH